MKEKIAQQHLLLYCADVKRVTNRLAIDRDYE